MLIPVAQPRDAGNPPRLAPSTPLLHFCGLGLEGTCKDTQQTPPTPPRPTPPRGVGAQLRRHANSLHWIFLSAGPYPSLFQREILAHARRGCFSHIVIFLCCNRAGKGHLGQSQKALSLSLSAPQPCRVCLRPEFSLKEQEAELLQQAGHFPFLRKGHPGGAVFYVPAEAICLQMSPAGRLSHTIS